MPKRILDTPSSAPPLAPYSVAVEAAGLVFLSGQVAIDPTSGSRAADDIESQTRQVLDNIGAVLADVGLGYNDVCKATVFLADMDDFAVVNEVYAEYFGSQPPARTAVAAAALPGGFRIEIDVVAALA